MKKLIWTFLALSQACTATDTGNPAEGQPNGSAGSNGEVTGNEGSDSCERTERELTDSNETTSLGFSAQQLLDLVSGEHSENLAWLGDAETYGPESGTTGIVLTVEPLGDVRFVDREVKPRSNGDEGPSGEIGLYGQLCGDLLEVDVRLQVATTGGALNEIVEATLTAVSPDYASLRVDLATDELSGSFVANVSAPPNSELTKAPTLSLDAAITAYGSTGEFRMFSEFASLNGTSISMSAAGALAQFPAKNYCRPGAVSVDASQTVRGLSIAEALEQLNATSPITASSSSQDATELSLDFSTNTERLCVRLNTPSTETTSIHFPASVALSTEDGRVNGNVAVNVYVQSEGSQSLRINSTATLNLPEDSEQAASRRGEFAIAGAIDFSSFDGGGYRFRTEVTADSQVGSLRAYGLTQPPCDSPEPPADGGEPTSTPGCIGTQETDLLNLTWGETP